MFDEQKRRMRTILATPSMRADRRLRLTNTRVGVVNRRGRLNKEEVLEKKKKKEGEERVGRQESQERVHQRPSDKEEKPQYEKKTRK